VCEALGPVRFDHWEKLSAEDLEAEGPDWPFDPDKLWPVGTHIQAPVVRCFATEEVQAGNTFDNALFMIENGNVWEKFGGFDTGKRQINLPDGGFIVSTTSAATSKDGGKDTFDIFDETHLWTLPRLKTLHNTVTRNLVKRKKADGWALETTTMYCPGEESVAEETFNAIDKGGGHIAGILFDHRQAPEDLNIKNVDDLRDSLKFVYGPAAAWTNIDSIIMDEFQNPTKRESDNRRYWLNQPWSTEDKYVTPSQWDAICEPGVKIPKGAEVVLSFDGAYNNDCTGILACSIEDTPILEVVDFWKRDPNLPLAVEWKVPRLGVMESLRQACKNYRVRMIVANPALWEMELETLEEERVAEVGAFNMQSKSMIAATKRLYDCITNDPDPGVHKVRHNGNEDLRSHMLAASIKEDARGVRVQKDPVHPQNKIDLCVCAIMATDQAMKILDNVPQVWSLEEVLADEAARVRAEAGEDFEDETEEIPNNATADRFIPMKYN
jgi:hypothetical protein